jgi:hypothetical protein
MDLMDQVDIEQVPVVDDRDREIPVGVLDRRTARVLVKEEVIRRQAPGPAPGRDV